VLDGTAIRSFTGAERCGPAAVGNAPPWSHRARGQQATDHLGPHYGRLWTRLAALELFHYFPAAADDLTGRRWPTVSLLCFR
jgi:hypothetical protein